MNTFELKREGDNDSGFPPVETLHINGFPVKTIQHLPIGDAQRKEIESLFDEVQKASRATLAQDFQKLLDEAKQLQPSE